MRVGVDIGTLPKPSSVCQPFRFSVFRLPLNLRSQECPYPPGLDGERGKKRRKEGTYLMQTRLLSFASFCSLPSRAWL